MIKFIGLWLMGSAVCVMPVAADENVHDGPSSYAGNSVTA